MERSEERAQKRKR